MSPKASGSSSERPITSASDGELTIFLFPIAGDGSRGSRAWRNADRGTLPLRFLELPRWDRALRPGGGAGGRSPRVLRAVTRHGRHRLYRMMGWPGEAGGA